MTRGVIFSFRILQHLPISHGSVVHMDYGETKFIHIVRLCVGLAQDVTLEELEDECCGTTLTMCLIEPSCITTCNVGDSRAIRATAGIQQGNWIGELRQKSTTPNSSNMF